MDPDAHVCLCFRVSLRKLANHVRREEPRVASQLSECLGAGTGCGWCVPFLKKIHAQWQAGAPIDLPVEPAEYARRRARYRATGQREDDAASPDASAAVDPPPHDAGDDPLSPATDRR